MRYRPFTKSGRSVSAITVGLGPRPQASGERLKLIYAALESGVNSFELQAADLVAAKDLGEALSAIDRELFLVTLRFGAPGQEAHGPMGGADRAGEVIRAALDAAHLDAFDAVIVETSAAAPASGERVAALQEAKSGGWARMIGLAGDDAGLDAQIAAGGFDILSTRFSLRSGWAERNRIKAAVDRNQTVVGYGYAPSTGSVDTEVRRRGLGRIFRRADTRPAAAYDFLQSTPGWTAEQIGLCYALTEPALASMRVEATSPEHVERVAACVERQLPNGVSAQIEMAHFTDLDRSDAA